MKELLYFSFAEMMVRVEYNKEANSLRYTSHRQITYGERVIIEQYLLTNFALKTEYYRKNPALFIYLGVDKKLVKDLNMFHLKNTLKSLSEKEKDVKSSVDNLINQSMESFYFNKIGDKILEIRGDLANDLNNETIQDHKLKLEELVEAYNQYTEDKIDVTQVVPADLQSHLHLAPESSRLSEDSAEQAEF